MIFFISLLLLSPFSEQLHTLLKKPEILCGVFKETKHLKGISQPLKTEGNFCVVSGKGVVWQTLKPFPNVLHLNKDSIKQMRDGKTILQLDAKNEPTVKIIHRVLFAVIQGDIEQLDSLFTIQGEIQKNNWKAELKPKSQAFGTIELEGNAYVKNITLHSTQGDRTEIIFSALKTGTLAPEMEPYFD